MKKSLLTFIFSLLVLFGFSQASVYHPFPDSNAAWRDSYGNVAMFPPGCANCVSDSEYAFVLGGDTAINGTKYHKLMEEGTNIYYGSNINYGQYHKRFYGAIREDTMKHIYLCCTSQLGNHDTLLYDFNMKVGDTLNEYNSSSALYNGPLYVTSIDSVQLLDSTYRKAFFLNDSNSMIIEGIGSMNGLLEPIIPENDVLEIWWELDCFKQNNKCLYSAYYPDTCILFDSTVGIALVIKPISVSTYPNPVSDKLIITVNGFEGKATFILYDEVGRQVFAINKIISADTQQVISMKDLSPGIYLLSISTVYGNMVKKIEVVR